MNRDLTAIRSMLANALVECATDDTTVSGFGRHLWFTGDYGDLPGIDIEAFAQTVTDYFSNKSEAQTGVTGDK